MSGAVHTTTSLMAGEKYEMLVKATDGGLKPMFGVAGVRRKAASSAGV